MAIRPVDIQLAILEGPYVAGVVEQSYAGPLNAQVSSQRAFASKAVQREEQVAAIDAVQPLAEIRYDRKAETRKDTRKGQLIDLLA